MAQQQLRVGKRNGVLIKCNFCGHIWLSRSTLNFVTCGACRNHVKVKYNVVTSEALSDIKESNPGPRDQSQAQMHHQLVTQVVNGGPY